MNTDFRVMGKYLIWFNWRYPQRRFVAECTITRISDGEVSLRYSLDGGICLRTYKLDKFPLPHKVLEKIED